MTIFYAIIGSSFFTAVLTKVGDFYSNRITYKNSKLHETKITEVKNFYKSYHVFKLALEDYHYYTMFAEQDSITTAEKSRSLLPLLREFQYQSMIIKLFIEKSDYNNVLKIEEILSQIQMDINQFHITREFDALINGDFGKRMIEILNIDFKITLPSLMSNIENSFRKSFI